MMFESNRLFLRPTGVEDAGFILRLLNTPKWIQYIGDRDVHSLKDAEKYIKLKMLPQLARLGYSNFTLINKADNAKIGCCGLYDREGIDGVDIGFALLPKYESKGFGLEAATRMLELAQTEWSISKVSAITSQENVASQKLLEKIGLSFSKLLTLNGEELRLYELSFTENSLP